MPQQFYVAERLFDKNNPYFSSFFLKFDCQELRLFFESHDKERRYLTHFFFYVESLVCVKNTSDTTIADFNTAGFLSHLHAEKLWYALLLTILIGIIDKTISNSMNSVVCECCGKVKNKAKESFKTIMLQMEEDEQKYLVNYYKGGRFRHEDFIKIIEDIYSDRTFFAHDIANLETPQKDGLIFDKRDEGVFIGFNIKPEAILLYIVKQLLKNWGYGKELLVSTEKEFKNISDFI